MTEERKADMDLTKNKEAFGLMDKAMKEAHKHTKRTIAELTGETG